MTGRGIDQILPCPGDATLWERYVHNARTYVRLAEDAHGPIPRPVALSWPWGDALPIIDLARPDVRIINLETAITARGTPAAGKGIHYRMNPANMGCLTVAQPDVCALANNHVLDFGVDGLTDTLTALASARVGAAGAGLRADHAANPVVVPVSGNRRVVVLSVGTGSSGIPPQWAAENDRPGIHLLRDLSSRTASDLAQRVREVKRTGDIAVLSVHWGTNWGYEVPDDQTRFARDLIDQGVDIIHGHSSHHPRPIEIYHERLILYGCGDFIDDYEGIGGYEKYRDDLRLAYLAALDSAGRLERVSAVPFQARRMRLRHASAPDVRYLRDLLDRISRPFRTRVDLAGDGTLEATPLPYGQTVCRSWRQGSLPLTPSRYALGRPLPAVRGAPAYRAASSVSGLPVVDGFELDSSSACSHGFVRWSKAGRGSGSCGDFLPCQRPALKIATSISAPSTMAVPVRSGAVGSAERPARCTLCGNRSSTPAGANSSAT